VSTVAQRAIDIATFGDNANIELRDGTFTWEKSYAYTVALVASSKVPNGDTVTFDAAISSPQELVAHDVFPPAVPSGVQAVFAASDTGQGAVDLTWNPSLDRDLAGYFVYRRDQASNSEAIKLNREAIASPAYRDANVQPGATYVYSVSAIDERGNESKRSEETSEGVPKQD
jgi:fibronectin type 3 domain-containing protein